LQPGAHTMVGRLHYWARRFEEAEREFRAVLEMEPAYVAAYTFLARTCWVTNRPAEALATLEQAVQHVGERTLLITALIGGSHARLGHVAEAREILGELRRHRATSYVPILYDSFITGGLGQTDEYFRQLEQAVSERSGWLPFTCVDPMLDPLRNEPRFAAVKRNVDFVIIPPPQPSPKQLKLN
jgi:tetratricopeptide (TPR) repeat protein